MGHPSARPLIIAHRGASKYAPENTLAAMRKAVELGVAGIELDVHLTQDKIPVVAHEDSLSPFTTSYADIHTTPLRAIRTIDVGRHFDAAFTGERIPTLEQVLELLKPSNVRINIELKAQPYWHFGLEERTAALVRAFGMEDRVVFSSFSPWMLMRLRYECPEVPRALLVGPKALLFVQTKIFGKIAKIANLHVFAGAMSPQLAEMAKKKGWALWIWTVNTRDELRRAIEHRADAIITDDPVLAREVIESYGV